MNETIYKNGDELNEEQLRFVAFKDSEIPAEFESDHLLDERRVEKSLELLKTMVKPYFFQVAFKENQIVGFHIVIQQNHLTKKIGNILTLWVDPAFRKKGIAKELKDRGVAWATKQGFPFIQTHVHVKNLLMQEINKKNGYSMNMYVMRKELPEPSKT